MEVLVSITVAAMVLVVVVVLIPISLVGGLLILRQMFRDLRGEK